MLRVRKGAFAVKIKERYHLFPVKPADLKPLFPRETPCVVYRERFLALPSRMESSFTCPAWSDIFGNDHPTSLEYCSGNGHWVIAQAKQHPESNWVAIEWQFERARKIWAKRANENIENLLIVCAEGHAFTQYHVQDHSVHNVFIHFPDPWPKRRHAKNRLVSAPFLHQLARIVASDGEFILVTDDPTYLEQAITLAQAAEGWSSVLSSPYFIEIPEYGASTFAALWQRQGRSFRMMRYRRTWN